MFVKSPRNERKVNDKRRRWAIFWCSGKQEQSQHLVNLNGAVALFKTRREAIEFNEVNFGYIKGRPDLKGHPHFWKFPRVVRVKIEYRWK